MCTIGVSLSIRAVQIARLQNRMCSIAKTFLMYPGILFSRNLFSVSGKAVVKTLQRSSNISVAQIAPNFSRAPYDTTSTREKSFSISTLKLSVLFKATALRCSRNVARRRSYKSGRSEVYDPVEAFSSLRTGHKFVFLS